MSDQRVPGYPPPPKTNLAKLWRATYAGLAGGGCCLVVLAARPGSWPSKLQTSLELGAACFALGLVAAFVIPLLPDKTKMPATDAAPPPDRKTLNPMQVGAVITLAAGLAPVFILFSNPTLAAQRGDPRAWAAIVGGLVIFWLIISAGLALMKLIKKAAQGR